MTKAENISGTYRSYQRRRLANALKGNFDFDRDYHAYVAWVEGDHAALRGCLAHAGGNAKLTKAQIEKAKQAYSAAWEKAQS
jgi:hypothetical protein